jgi:hypothetical protein
MPSTAVRLALGFAIVVTGVVLLGDLALVGVLPVIAIVAVVAFQHAAQSGSDVNEELRSEVRRHLVDGRPDAAAELVVPLLNERSPGRRRWGAGMLALAAQTGASDPAVIDALPRLVDLAPTYRIGRALVAHGRLEAAAEVLGEAGDGHDPVAWAEYLGVLAALERFDALHAAVQSGSTSPPMEAVLLAARRMEPGAQGRLRAALAERGGGAAAAVLVLAAVGPDAEETLTGFIADNRHTADPDLAAWVAWAGAVLGSPVALAHLEEVIGRSASGRTAVAAMLAALHVGRPDVALQIGPTALRAARPEVRVALHLAHAQALVTAGYAEEAVAQLTFVPMETALSAAITPPLSPSIREAESWPALAERLIVG